MSRFFMLLDLKNIFTFEPKGRFTPSMGQNTPMGGVKRPPPPVWQSNLL